MRLSLILMIGILILLPTAIAFSPVTGYFSSSYKGEDILIDEKINAHTAFEFELFDDESIVTSLTVFGSVKGDGEVKIFAEDEFGNKFLVAKYRYEGRSGFSRYISSFISGMGESITGSVVETRDEPDRYLDAVCVDTCDFQGRFKGNKLKLAVDVEENTQLNLYKIYYQTYSPPEQKLDAPGKSFFARVWDKIFG